MCCNNHYVMQNTIDDVLLNFLFKFNFPGVWNKIRLRETLFFNLYVSSAGEVTFAQSKLPFWLV